MVHSVTVYTEEVDAWCRAFAGTQWKQVLNEGNVIYWDPFQPQPNSTVTLEYLRGNPPKSSHMAVYNEKDVFVYN